MKLSTLLCSALPVAVLATPSSETAPFRRSRDAGKAPNFSFKELYNIYTHFTEQYMYPNNAVQAKSINSTLFSDDVLGRVDITRTFVGRELNTEYIFGLWANLAGSDQFSLIGIPVSYELTHFAANGNVMSSAAVIYFNITALGIQAPIEIDAWFTVNKHKKINQYDVTFRYLQWHVDWLLSLAQEKFGLPSPTATVELVTQLLAESVCGTAQRYCNGTNMQYSNSSQCMDFLTQQIPFGQTYQLGMNTLLCRMVHQNMVPYRPDVHCPHIGPSGGGYCSNDRTYEGTVEQPFYTNAPFVPYGYQNKNKTIAAM